MIFSFMMKRFKDLYGSVYRYLNHFEFFRINKLKQVTCIISAIEVLEHFLKLRNPIVSVIIVRGWQIVHEIYEYILNIFDSNWFDSALLLSLDYNQRVLIPSLYQTRCLRRSKSPSYLRHNALESCTDIRIREAFQEL